MTADMASDARRSERWNSPTGRSLWSGRDDVLIARTRVQEKILITVARCVYTMRILWCIILCMYIKHTKFGPMSLSMIVRMLWWSRWEDEETSVSAINVTLPRDPVCHQQEDLPRSFHVEEAKNAWSFGSCIVMIINDCRYIDCLLLVNLSRLLSFSSTCAVLALSSIHDNIHDRCASQSSIVVI